jgi:c-di-GMP-binding flagellar brake protein YcgR
MASRKARRSERRDTTRADARLSMRVEGTPEGGAGPSQLVTESQNISASGVYCFSEHYLAPLSKVALTIVLPKVPGSRGTKELIKCEGIVVRCESPRKRGDRHYELACMFSSIEPEWRQRIDEFVTWRNLQALRSVASPASGVNGRARTAGTARARRPAAKKKVTRRRTVH